MLSAGHILRLANNGKKMYMVHFYLHLSWAFRQLSCCVCTACLAFLIPNGCWCTVMPVLHLFYPTSCIEFVIDYFTDSLLHLPVLSTFHPFCWNLCFGVQLLHSTPFYQPPCSTFFFSFESGPWGTGQRGAWANEGQQRRLERMDEREEERWGRKKSGGKP